MPSHVSSPSAKSFLGTHTPPVSCSNTRERRHREAGLEAGQPLVRAVEAVRRDVVGDGHVRVVREAGLPGQRARSGPPPPAARTGRCRPRPTTNTTSETGRKVPVPDRCISNGGYAAAVSARWASIAGIAAAGDQRSAAAGSRAAGPAPRPGRRPAPASRTAPPPTAPGSEMATPRFTCTRRLDQWRTAAHPAGRTQRAARLGTRSREPDAAESRCAGAGSRPGRGCASGAVPPAARRLPAAPRAPAGPPAAGTPAARPGRAPRPSSPPPRGITSPRAGSRPSRHIAHPAAVSYGPSGSRTRSPRPGRRG